MSLQDRRVNGGSCAAVLPFQNGRRQEAVGEHLAVIFEITNASCLSFPFL
jgi:hypothetical protein